MIYSIQISQETVVKYHEKTGLKNLSTDMRLPLESKLGAFNEVRKIRTTKNRPTKGANLKMKGFIEVTAIFKHTERTLINISHIKEVVKCDDNGEAFIVLSSDAKKRKGRLLRTGFYVSECYDCILDKIREAVEG